MSRYIQVPADAMLAACEQIGQAVAGKGGRFERTRAGDEIVFVLAPRALSDRPCPEVHIYTSLPVGGQAVRACGTDAVRLVLLGPRAVPGYKTPELRPLASAVRVFRTAPKGAEADRVQAFLVRFRDAVREVYKQALSIPSCPACKGVMAHRSSAHGPFWGCLAFPGCRGTRPDASTPQ